MNQYKDSVKGMKYVEAYGYCPCCGTTRGVSRERSPNGNTWCAECGASSSREWKPLESNDVR
jgi:hypothetical protein